MNNTRTDISFNNLVKKAVNNRLNELGVKPNPNLNTSSAQNVANSNMSGNESEMTSDQSGMISNQMRMNEMQMNEMQMNEMQMNEMQMNEMQMNEMQMNEMQMNEMGSQSAIDDMAMELTAGQPSPVEIETSMDSQKAELKAMEEEMRAMKEAKNLAEQAKIESVDNRASMDVQDLGMILCNLKMMMNTTSTF